jgi:hypothetical protein
MCERQIERIVHTPIMRNEFGRLGMKLLEVALWKTGMKLVYDISKNNTKVHWVSEVREILWVFCLKRGFGTCVDQGSSYTARDREIREN